MQKHNRKICGKNYNAKYLDFIYVNDMKRIIYPDIVSQTFTEQLKKSGMEKVRFHELSRTYTHATRQQQNRAADFYGTGHVGQNRQ